MAVQGVLFHQAIDTEVLALLDPVADDTTFTSGKDMEVPLNMSQIIAAQYLCSIGERGVIDSPMIRRISRVDVQSINRSASQNNTHRVADYRNNPIQVAPGESLNALGENATSSAAVRHTLAVWLSDGQITPVTGANLHTVYGTASFSATAYAWHSGQITLDTDLPSGTYDIVGFRAWSTGMLYARLIFTAQGPRPMVMGATDASSVYAPLEQPGVMGVLGTMQNFVPPKLEVFTSATASSFSVELDVVRQGGI